MAQGHRTEPEGYVRLKVKVSGRPYTERDLWCCFECSKTMKRLRQEYGEVRYLTACGCKDCVVLLCEDCKVTHEAVHLLAGDKVESNWERKKLNVFHNV